ncbi:MAG TPA: hypothetical protein VGM31_04500 [Puia sp.]|jgi:hypothetical protein
MYQLNDQEIDLILADLHQRGIETESMRMNLLDHICILIEDHLEENGNFGQFYATTIRSFYKDELRELEDETRLLMALNKKHLLLSRNQFFLSLATLLIIPVLYRQICLVLLFHPLLVLLVIFLTPERFDPLVPHRSRILLGPSYPFIKIVPVDWAGPGLSIKTE